MTTRKLLYPLMFVTLVAALLVACSSATPEATEPPPAKEATKEVAVKEEATKEVVVEEEPTAEAAAEVVDLTLWMLADENTSPVFQGYVDAFNAANPTIQVEMETYPNEAYKTTIQVAVASDNPPDVFFNWSGDDTARYVREGNILDLTSYAKKYGWFDTLSAAALDAYTIDGNLYGMPYTLHSKYFFYNTAIFKEQGLKPPATFDELLGICKSLDEAGIIPISFGNSERWQGVHYLSTFNQKMAGEDNIAVDYTLSAPEDTLFTDAGYVEALQKLLDMQDAGCFAPGVNATDPATAWSQFYTEQAAMTYAGTWGFGIFDSNDFAGQYSIFPMPAIAEGKGNQNYIWLSPDGIEVSAKTAYPDEAAKFVDYFVSEESQKTLVEKLGSVPIRPVQAEMSEGLALVADNVANAEGTAPVIDVLLENSVSEVYLNGIQEVLGKTKTPAEVMEAVRQQALTVKQELGK